MIKLNFLNTTTSMPFDRDLEKYFYEVFNKRTFKNYHREGFLDGLSIFFVSKDELDKELRKIEEYSDEIFNPDKLGVYFPYHESIRNELIMICPEKIMECAYHLRTKQTSDELLMIYKVLIVKVILHELAHALMSANDKYYENKIKRSYDFITRIWIDNKNIDTSWFFDKDSNHFHPSGYRSYNWYKIIEESLANAFVSLHSFTEEEKNIIDYLINKQPDGYKHASFWYPCENLLGVMISWRDMKYNWYKFEKQTTYKKLDMLQESIVELEKCDTKIDFIKLLGESNDTK